MKCCICGSETTSLLDPWPICYEDGAVCCQRCYTLTVLPAKLRKQQYLQFFGLAPIIDAEEEDEDVNT